MSSGAGITLYSALFLSVPLRFREPHTSEARFPSLVWSDVRRFLEDSGKILDRVREQLGNENNCAELEARQDDLAKRLAAKQAEKDRYVRTYAQGYISEEELNVYLADLKNQTANIRLLLEPVEAERSQKREQTELAHTTEVWLQTLRERLEEVEGDTSEAFRERRQLVKLLVQSISAGKRPDDGRAEIQITYRFGPQPGEGYSDGSAGGEDESSVVPCKNGSRSYFTKRPKSG
jgi:hypothetical protein